MKMVNVMHTFALAALFAVQANAGVITGITASASSQYNANTSAAHTIDGSGLTGDQHDVNFQHAWFSDDSAGTALNQEWIQWDFGQGYVLESIQVWNLNQNTTGAPGNLTANGINQVDIYISSVASPGDPEGAGAANWTVLKANAVLAKASGLNTYTGFDLATQIGVALPNTAIRWVRFEVDTAFTGRNTSFDVGLSEIRFIAVIPAPAALPAGLGLLGLVLWRRR
ncbi:MAG: hypothetical protein GC162_08940 [Planctomycetes bacterium]|nr:hypothetical protein [Planctomycetota bacterium]